MKITIDFIKSENIFSIIPLLKMLDPSIKEDVLKSRLSNMSQQGYQCIGAYKQNELIGICGIWVLEKYYVGKHLEMDNIIVSPNYRSHGIGEKIIIFIEEYAKKIGCVAGELNCYIKNEEAHRFWERCGYQAIALHFQKKFK